MCNPRMLLGAVLLALAAVRPAVAQEVEARLDALRARSDSLLVARAAAQARLDSIYEMSHVAGDEVQLDTQRVGPLLVVSTADAADIVREVTSGALERYGPVADAIGPQLRATVLLVEHGRGVRAFDEMRLAPGHRRVWLPRWRPSAWKERLVAREIGTVLTDALPSDLRAWMGGKPLVPVDGEQLRETYRALASGFAEASARCRADEMERCADALSLTDPAPMGQHWYSLDQLIALSVERPLLRGADEELGPACRAARTMDACAPWLRARPLPDAPLDENARATLASHVLDRGGTRAWQVLSQDSTGELRHRLARAAGVDDSALLHSWLESVRAAQPRHSAGMGREFLVTLLWAVVFAAIATRSTRWRLG